MNMFDEKDPRQKSIKADASEDEVIIDLTDEVSDKAENGNGILESSNDMADIPPQANEDDEVSEEEEILALDEPDILESQEENTTFIDLNNQGEDQLIASAIKNVIQADKDDTDEKTEQFDLNSFDSVKLADKDEDD
jgi:hypothetical protein